MPSKQTREFVWWLLVTWNQNKRAASLVSPPFGLPTRQDGSCAGYPAQGDDAAGCGAAQGAVRVG